MSAQAFIITVLSVAMSGGVIWAFVRYMETVSQPYDWGENEYIECVCDMIN